MTIESLVDKTYGPYPYRTCEEKVAEFMEATRDDPSRWTDSAPPSLAGAALFVVAPHLLGDPAISSHARSVIHGNQSFVWHGPIPLEHDLEVSGTVTKVRERSGVAFVGFDMQLSAEGKPLVHGKSTFLMSGDAPPAGISTEESEPDPEVAGSNHPAPAGTLPGEGDAIPTFARSASRADLVRYAAASRDWNPIHWDHDSAVAAGLPGVVAHGLLQAAWLCQGAARFSTSLRPIREARFRFRAPLRPATPAEVTGTAKADRTLDLALASRDTIFVAATMQLAA